MRAGSWYWKCSYRCIGFKPTIVKVYNRTTNVQAVWNRVMPDASLQKVVDSGSGTTDVSFVTSNGITPTFNGFTIGTDSSVNNASDVIYWEAYK